MISKSNVSLYVFPLSYVSGVHQTPQTERVKHILKHCPDVRAAHTACRLKIILTTTVAAGVLPGDVATLKSFPSIYISVPSCLTIEPAAKELFQRSDDHIAKAYAVGPCTNVRRRCDEHLMQELEGFLAGGPEKRLVICFGFVLFYALLQHSSPYRSIGRSMRLL